MFAARFFPKTYFVGTYFPPAGDIVLTEDESAPLVGMVFNFGTMMGRR